MGTLSPTLSPIHGVDSMDTVKPVMMVASNMWSGDTQWSPVVTDSDTLDWSRPTLQSYPCQQNNTFSIVSLIAGKYKSGHYMKELIQSSCGNKISMCLVSAGVCPMI